MKVAVHVFDGITLFHASAPLAVFGEVTRQQHAAWTTVLWSSDGRAVRTAEHVLLADIAGPEAVVDADLVVFPSWPADLPAAEEAFLDLVRECHARGAVIVGLCLGAFPVAASGVLAGRRAVTHWAAADSFRAQNPSVELELAALYVDHGDVLTSAGTASALDACLHLVRSALGAAVAAEVARRLVIAPHREGDQAQYIRRPAPANDGPGPIPAVIDWALAHLDQELTLDVLAARATMSPRNFTRRFAETTGVSPLRWVLARRLDESRRLLETSDWTVERVARHCGFRSAVTFRQHFTRAYATTPTSYRSRFRTVQAISPDVR